MSKGEWRKHWSLISYPLENYRCAPRLVDSMVVRPWTHDMGISTVGGKKLAHGVYSRSSQEAMLNSFSFSSIRFDCLNCFCFLICLHKCHDRYSPCNFCCYHGASSLKLRFFGCSGNTSIVLDDLLDDNGCNYNGCDEWTSVNTTSNEIDSGVQFVDCDCFDDATNISSSSFGDIASCDLFDHKIFYPASSDRAASSFDLCLVSTTNCRNGPVANFSQPLPDVIGLKHFRNGNAAFGNDVTFFETTCDEKGITSSRNFTNPLFPGYGKLAGTCPDIGKPEMGLKLTLEECCVLHSNLSRCVCIL